MHNNSSAIRKPLIPVKLIEFLDNYENFIIAGHKEPDGDCIGSCLAMSLFLKRKNKNCILMSAGPFKRTEIKDYEKFFTDKLEISDKINPKNSGLIILDCSGFDRVGDIATLIRNFNYIIIDHHATNTERSDNSLIMPEAPSTTYLIQSIIEEMGEKPTKEEAEALFFGLCTDTGFFRHLDERSAEVFNHASRLIAAGANPKQTFMKMNGGKKFASRLLISRILDRMKPYYDGRLVISYETYDDAMEFGLESRDSDILYQLIQTMEGVEAICIVRQESPTHCSVGFRSLDKIDVSKIALSFGGGGHKQASGLYIEGKFDELIPKFVEAFGSQM
ncbi:MULTISPECIES: bifunctional oligoribonuclease/PAP phosphatase NrnA [unclassified Treponema]|uniref:DHH family phosphoesterase n=1 Tax=unclassified Treponema TaxID=2638727 RepID=UPI0020A4609C|nr:MULTISPECIES: bifunctional oligoribonuclease/PAP phosphatase NrnA [unclassified Treponema]UTC68146.1 bifunctional oligoribonuclease/PAP phosphatase NrnA [Treponema sp. OMZ 789]UTC70868.1 bifunctional oligoribonuclease/PAP phosphatase NrnA [Treponema sp. OMZ 790]UTC73608.1 bifunctional oligoribonuclease/PAP phosphatase NrnA [Treponema sp. OMZ 791]